MRVLVVGGGEVGALITRRLVRGGSDVTILDADPERCAQLESTLDVKVVPGNAARVRAMRRAGIADAEMLIAVTDRDETNLLACLIGQVESKARVKVARLRTHEVDEWRRMASESGVKIDLVIHPESEIAERIMRVLRFPGISDLVDFADGHVRLFGMNVEPKSRLVDKTLEELRRAGMPRQSLVALVFRGAQVIIPHGADTLRAGDHAYIIASRRNFEAVLRFVGLEAREEVKRVFIVGGRQVGITVAERLEQKGVSVKLFEHRAERAAKVATLLERTVVIHGDGKDQATLEEHTMEGLDAYLALTEDDEDNIIAALLARRLGARKVVALINRLSYLPMAQRLGVNTTVSPRLAAADRILQFVRKGHVLSVTTFRDEEAEAIELIAGPNTRYVGQRLRDVRFPRGTLVGAIVRPEGEVVVPSGEDAIEAGDRVIFFAMTSVVPRLESAFLASDSKGRP